MSTVRDTLAAAFAHHQRGELAQAQALYRQVLEADPQQADAWHLLGLVAHQEGRNEEAARSISQAISLNDKPPDFHNHLGAVYGALGQMDAADASFRRALELAPADPQVHYNLAALLNLQGKSDAAIDHYRRTIALNPKFAEAHFNLGNVFRDRQEWNEAERAYRDALAVRPRYVKALASLASLWWKQDRTAEAEDAWRQVAQIDPRHVEARFRLGSALQARGELQQAIEWLQSAILLDQRHVDAQNNLGCAHRGLGQLDQAEQCFRLALSVNPDSVEAQNNLGSVLHEKKDYTGATACFQKAVELDPNFAGAYGNLATVLQSQKQYDAAVELYHKSLAMKPDSPETLANLGSCLSVQGKTAEGIELLRRAVALDSSLPMAHYCLAVALHLERREEEALAEYDEAIRLKPDYADAYSNRAYAHLSQGDLAAGWRDYEWRLRCKGYKARRFDAPQWDGSPPAGRRLLVHAEQGLGDTLHFVRYLPLLQRAGDSAILEVPPVLVPLLKASGFTGVIPAGSPLPHFDVHIPLLSLPGVFGTTLETIPASAPYLAADPKLLKHWRARLRNMPGFKVGIVWQGNAAYTFDQFRSIPLVQFAPLAEVPHVQLVSLQKGQGTEQLEEIATRFAVLDLGSTLDAEAGAFMDTSAVMSSLDLVVTSDTAAAHLAGGLGVPTWLALSAAPEWRWMNDRTDSPWYPTMRLFRQKSLGDWPSVFRTMKSELATLAASQRPAS